MTIAMLGLGLYAVVIAIIMRSRRETVQFLRRHHAITDRDSIDQFKALARRNMKTVPPLTGLFFVAMALTAQLIIHHRVIGFVALLLLTALVAWSALALNGVEKRVRELPCPDPALALEYERVAQSWLSDLWPRF
jgi:hypothetical protein